MRGLIVVALALSFSGPVLAQGLMEKVEQTITIKPDGRIEVKDTTLILRDGDVVARQNHRHVVDPADVGERDDELSAESPRVKAVMDEFWTQAVIDARKAQRQEAREAAVP